jgi:hypothetical protein
MRILFAWLLLSGAARAQIDDEPTPGAVRPPATAAPPPATIPPAAISPPAAVAPSRPSGADVVLHLESGNDIVGRLVYGDAETVTLEMARSRQNVTLFRNQIRDLQLAAVPTPETERQRLGARRFKHAGLGLMMTGAFCEVMVALLWAAAVPISNQSYYSERSSVLIGAGAADIAFGIIGAQFLVMGGVFYTVGRGEERHYGSGLAWRF